MSNPGEFDLNLPDTDGGEFVPSDTGSDSGASQNLGEYDGDAGGNPDNKP